MKDKYRASTPLGTALDIWMDSLKMAGLLAPLEGEPVAVADALGRVTAGAVFARTSSPGWHSAAMDGYAVRALDTFGASETAPKRLNTGTDAVLIDTGKPMPDGFDAVIMHEDLSEAAGCIEFTAPVPPWKNVRTAGEDIVATELIVPENHKLRPMDLAAILSGGISGIKARRKPKIIIIPTGSDLIDADTAAGELRKGLIIESNSSMLAGMAAQWGALAGREKIIPDEPDALGQAISSALGRADMVVVNAGASLGTKDYTLECIEKAGRVVLHGVAIKPGKPVILGIINGKPVIGTPGYPVSACTAFNLFARPVIYAMQGLEPGPPGTVTGRLSRSIPSSLGQEEFIRVKVGSVDGKYIVTPLARGAGQLMSLVRADGLLNIPSMSEGIGQGSDVTVELLREKHEIENTAVLIGSHDSALDILSSFLKRRHHSMSLSSAHVGSMGGLMALKRGEAHIAPAHLLDEKTGQYNFPFIKKILPEKKIVLVNLVYREQGLMVPRGNPENIKGFEDLRRARFVNRQPGSGTRLLLDKHLGELGIKPQEVYGYGNEQFTHMAVASAVLSGAADTGLGVLGAARALGLDFIQVARERYDLAIPAEFAGLPVIKALLEIIRTDEGFRETIMSMGGYGLEDMGKVMYESRGEASSD
ncbi:MAG: molybdopterin biosynthesis protein [Nitrospiraceae bacterium]|nr:molybdopterin biosynthesis protein [Nitrospiraceae bacterium]